MQIEKYDIFTLATSEEKTTLALGQYKLKEFDSTEQAKKYVDEKPYELIINVSAIATIRTLEQLKEEEEQQKTNN